MGESVSLPWWSDGKESACSVGDWIQSLCQEDPLEKEMAAHSSILAWRIPCTEKPGGVQSMGSCWSFNGPELGGSKSKKEADIPWFMQKAKSPVLRACAAARRHQAPSPVGEGTERLLERVLEARARK